MKDGPGSLHFRVHPAWWVEPGFLLVAARFPRRLLALDGELPGKGSPIATFERQDELLEGTLSDALAVGAALQRCVWLQRVNEDDEDERVTVLKAHLTPHCKCL